MVGTEHMYENTMFTLSEEFSGLNTIVDDLRSENRAIVLQLVTKAFLIIWFFDFRI